MPDAMLLRGRRIELSYPDEVGVRNDFFVCLIDDEYGLGELSSPIATIVDIGSNMGFFALAARQQFPSAIIQAYEPNSRALSYLSANAAAANCKIYPEAVGASEGWVNINDSGDSNQAQTSVTRDGNGAVAQVALSTVVQRLGGEIHLAKIDCEGAEWDLFEDPSPWSRIKHVRMEYHLWGRRRFTEVQTAFNRLGFAIDYHNPAGEWGTVWAHNRSN